MSISNAEYGQMEGTDFSDGGSFKLTTPSTDVHKICFDGRYLKPRSKLNVKKILHNTAFNRSIFTYIYSNLSYSWNVDRRLTFFVVVGDVGYDEEKDAPMNDNGEMLKLGKKYQEANMTLQLIETLYSLNRQIEMLQWGRKQTSNQDMLRMEAILSK